MPRHCIGGKGMKRGSDSKGKSASKLIDALNAEPEPDYEESEAPF